jgi:hypothetical protein
LRAQAHCTVWPFNIRYFIIHNKKSPADQAGLFCQLVLA